MPWSVQGSDWLGKAIDQASLDDRAFSDNWKSMIAVRPEWIAGTDANEADKVALAKTQTDVQSHLIAQRQAEEKRLSAFLDQALSQLQLVSRPDGPPLSVEIKKQVLNADWYKRRVAESVLVGGFEVNEAKQRFGNEAWKQVPLFLGRAQLNTYGVKVAEQFGIKSDTPEFREFLTYQNTFIAARKLHFHQ
jgi:hypothetical protein